MSFSAWVRGISGTPTRACIAGDTGRGFVMPLGGLFPSAAGGGLEAAEARSAAAGAAHRRRGKPVECDGRGGSQVRKVGKKRMEIVAAMDARVW